MQTGVAALFSSGNWSASWFTVDSYDSSAQATVSVAASTASHSLLRSPRCADVRGRLCCAQAYVTIAIPDGSAAYDEDLTPREVYASLVQMCCLSACTGPSQSICNGNSSFYSPSFALLENSTSFAMQCCDGSYVPTLSGCSGCTGSAPSNYTAIIGAVLGAVFGVLVLWVLYIVYRRRKASSEERHRAGVKLNDAPMLVSVPGGGADGAVMPIRKGDDISPLPSARKHRKARKPSMAEVEIHIDEHPDTGIEIAPSTPAAASAAASAPDLAASAAVAQTPRTSRARLPSLPALEPIAAADRIASPRTSAAQEPGETGATVSSAVVPPLAVGALNSVPEGSPKASPEGSPEHRPKGKRHQHLKPLDNAPTTDGTQPSPRGRAEKERKHKSKEGKKKSKKDGDHHHHHHHHRHHQDDDEKSGAASARQPVAEPVAVAEEREAAEEQKEV